MPDDKKVIATIKKTLPAVVSIMISKHLSDLEREIPHALFPFLPGHPHAKRGTKPIFKIPGFLADERGMVEVGGGSGFFVDPKGLVLTNKHVISDPKAEYTVVASDGQKYPASVLSRDPINDVAILKVQGSGFTTVPLGDATKLDLGESVIAIGNALGLFKNTVSAGIVSGLSRSIAAKADPTAPLQEMRGLIQTDAAINPGNSGGPLVDLAGRAIGINAAIVYGAQSIGFAIPINAAERDLDDIAKYGRIRRPFLGIRYVIIDERLQRKMKLPVPYGAMVSREGPHESGVVPGSPAALAGIRDNDIILKCNDTKVDTDHPIQDFLEKMDVGDVLTMSVLRNGREFNLKVPLAERV